MVSSITNSACDVRHKLPNDLRLRIFSPRHFRRWRGPAHTRKKILRILGNKEILVKSQIWMETFKAPFQKLNFGNSSPKTRKSRIKLFLTCPVLLDFFFQDWRFKGIICLYIVSHYINVLLNGVFPIIRVCSGN